MRFLKGEGEAKSWWDHRQVIVDSGLQHCFLKKGKSRSNEAAAPEAAVCEMHHYQQLEPRLLSPRQVPPVSSLATRLTGLEGQCRLSPPACLLHSSAALTATEQGITTMLLQNSFRNILPNPN